METNKIEIDAYKKGSRDEKKLLEKLYGKKMFLPKNIMERIKTFEDAIKELGNDHTLVKVYNSLLENGFHGHLLVYQKLRIITTALNEGWKPKFTENEYRYYPYFFFYTQKQIDDMSEDNRANVLILEKPIGDYVGVFSAYLYCGPSSASSRVDSRLYFKNRELAEYAGRQFIDIYNDYYLK